MNDPIFHPATRQQFEKFLQRPSHAVIIHGPEGIGKYTVSTWLGAKLLGLKQAEEFENYAYETVIRPDGQSISIQAMRDLANFTKLKIPKSDGSTNRIIIIEHAYLLTIEAQNALLKMLEEPPADTVIILTAPSDQSLLPTIRSRAQKIQVQIPSPAELAERFTSQGHATTKINQILLMGGGLPGLMHALLEQKDDHPLVKASESAREILKADAFSRQCMVDSLSKQRGELERLIFMMKQMAHAAIAQNAARGSDTSVGRWHRIQSAAYRAESALRANAQPKLVLSSFMLQI